MPLNPDEDRIRIEIDHHLAELRAQLEAQGVPPHEARAEAERRFGDPSRIERTTPTLEVEGRWARLLAWVAQDARFAMRQIIRKPLVSALTVATLVVGVSATAVVFSVVNAVVLAPLPFQAPDELVHLQQTSPQGRFYSTSEPNYVDFRARQRSFVELAAIGYGNPILSGLGEAESVAGLTVTHTLFPLVGIVPVLGRGFLPEEDVFRGANDVVVLSDAAWARRFGRADGVIGETVILDGVARRIVGVVPSGRAWPGVEFFTPLAPNPDLYRDDQRIQVLGRLLPSVSLAAAQEDLSSIAAQLSAEYPESNDRWGASVRPARDWLIGTRLTQLGGFLLGSVALFLLMACASVSNLLLARASSRMQEMGIRTALGAGRARIAAQLATEGMMLAVVGGVLSVLVSAQLLHVVQALGPADLVRLDEASVNGAVLAIVMTAMVTTVLVAGLAPALLIMRGGEFVSLRAGGGLAAASGRRFRDWLVAGQFALAVAVVVGAGLLTRSFVELQGAELGFEAGQIVRFSVRLPGDRFEQEGRVDYLRLLNAEIAAIPGVEAVGATTAPPFSNMRPSNFVARSDQEPARQEDFQPVSWRAVEGDFFSAAGIPLLTGRTFEDGDRIGPGGQPQNPPVIIDATLAALLWPGGEDPIGRRVTWFLPGGQQCVVVGVVGSARDERMDGERRPRIYRPFSYTSWDEPSVLVRATDDPGVLIPEIRRVALALDPSVPAIAPTLVTQDIRNRVAWPRFTSQVLGVFALIALVLAAMGIYGVTAFSVARRRREMGVRVALGADPTGVRRMVIRGALRLALTGITAGLIASLVATRFLGTLLYDVSATDPATFVTVPLVLVIVATLAAWLPATRAMAGAPQAALTGE